MRNTYSHNIQIDSVFTITPKNKVHSEDIIKMLDNDDRKYFRDSYKKFGVESRFVAEENETFESLAYGVAKEQIARNSINKDEICCLIVVSQTSTSRLPNAGHLIHRELGLNSDCLVFDMNDGCNGYINALEVASRFIVTNKKGKILIIAGDVMSKYTDSNEISNKLLIGDAVTSTVISYKDITNGYSLIKNDGSDADAISLIQSKNDKFFQMDGFRVYSFAMQKVPKLYKEFITKFDQVESDFDFIILHQANMLLNSNIIRRMKVDKKKFPGSLEQYANTGPASIPVTLSLMDFTKERNLLLIGFGAGLSWGAISINASRPLVQIIS